ncbi:MAG: hypothetical protein AAF333_09205 [Planctomycetota bacterium]
MDQVLITFGWVWFALGIVSGAVLGLGFHRADFMGGYGSWRRRLARLGHISFFGTGMLAMMMGITSIVFKDAMPAAMDLPGVFLGVGVLTLSGGVTMPVVCFLAAWRKPLRHLFFIPVLGLGGGVLGFAGSLVWGLFMKGGVS